MDMDTANEAQWLLTEYLHDSAYKHRDPQGKWYIDYPGRPLRSLSDVVRLILEHHGVHNTGWKKVVP